MKKGILGGSFDPVHYGHLILADQLCYEAGLDKIIFIPAYKSPFKTDSTQTDAADRFEMLKLAVASNPKFEVSDIEINKEGPSYTIDTLNALKEQNPDDELYFILGQDSFTDIQKWHKSDELISSFAFIIGRRPGESTKETFAVQKELLMTHKNLRIEYFDIPEMDISSTVLRNKIRLGKPVRYFMPDAVIDYIDKHNLYGSLIPKLKSFVKANVKESRYKHTEGVVDTARKLAVRYDVDPQKAEIAAWFHDAFRSAGNLEHGPMAADKLEELFGVKDPDILNAIRFHTTGHRGMCDLEKVIYVADSLEPGRDFPGVNELRKIMYTGLDEVMYELMTHTRDYVHGLGAYFDPESDLTIEELKGRLNR